MHGDGLCRVLLRTIFMLSCLLSAVTLAAETGGAGEHGLGCVGSEVAEATGGQSCAAELVPQEGPTDGADISSRVQGVFGLRSEGLLLQPKEVLEVLKQCQDRTSAISDLTGAYLEALLLAKAGGERAALGDSLKELVNGVLLFLRQGKDWRNEKTFLETLVRSRKLDAEAWSAYADAAMKDIAKWQAPNNAAMKILKSIMLEAATAGSLTLISATVASSERAQVDIYLADNGGEMVKLAIWKGHVELTRYLIAKKMEDHGRYRKISLYEGMTENAFVTAAEAGHLDVMKALFEELEKHPELEKELDPTTRGFNYPIFLAFGWRHYEVVEYMLSKKEEDSGRYGAIYLEEWKCGWAKRELEKRRAGQSADLIQ